MARTGKGRNARRSDMPAMTKGLPEPLIYDYDPVELHVKTNPKLARPGERQLRAEPEPPLTAFVTTPCWTGRCPGCGRGLVSATTSWKKPADYFFCGPGGKCLA